jgi:hypothetical protein
MTQYDARLAGADYLLTHIQNNSNKLILFDERTVQALSGIPPEKFLTSSDAPRDRESFLNYLKEKNVEYLVFIDTGDSTPAKMFPESKNGKGNELIQPVLHARARFLRTDIWVYRFELEKLESIIRHSIL